MDFRERRFAAVAVAAAAAACAGFLGLCAVLLHALMTGSMHGQPGPGPGPAGIYAIPAVLAMAAGIAAYALIREKPAGPPAGPSSVAAQRLTAGTLGVMASLAAGVLRSVSSSVTGSPARMRRT